MYVSIIYGGQAPKRFGTDEVSITVGEAIDGAEVTLNPNDTITIAGVKVDRNFVIATDPEAVTRVMITPDVKHGSEMFATINIIGGETTRVLFTAPITVAALLAMVEINYSGMSIKVDGRAANQNTMVTLNDTVIELAPVVAAPQARYSNCPHCGRSLKIVAN